MRARAILAVRDAYVGVSEGIRFNQLLRFAKEFIDSNIAAPTVIRHLKHLRKGKIVSRTRRGKQNITYSLTTSNSLVSKSDLEDSARLLKSYKEHFGAMNPEKIIETFLLLSRLLELKTLEVALQIAFTKEKIENLKLKGQITKAVYRQYGDLLVNAAIEKAEESKEILDLIRIEIKKTRDQLFPQSSD